MMADVSLMTLVLASAAMAASTYGACDYFACMDIVKNNANDVTNFCRFGPLGIECDEKTLRNNPDCSAAIKEEVDSFMKETQEHLDELCYDRKKGGTETSTSEGCDVQACLNNLVASDDDNDAICRGIQNALACVETTLKTNTFCTEEEKLRVGVKVQANYKNVKCGDAPSTTFGYCDVQACMGESVSSEDKGEMCSGAREVVACYNTRITNNNLACPEDEKRAMEAQVTASYTYLKDNDCGGVAGLMPSLTLCLGLSVTTYFLTRRR